MELNPIKLESKVLFKPTWSKTSTVCALEFNDFSLQWFSLPHYLPLLYCIALFCILLCLPVLSCTQLFYNMLLCRGNISLLYFYICTVFCVSRNYISSVFLYLHSVLCVSRNYIWTKDWFSVFTIPHLLPQHFLKMMKCANDSKVSRKWTNEPKIKPTFEQRPGQAFSYHQQIKNENNKLEQIHDKWKQ